MNNNSGVVGIIQARMQSSRLPGKMMKDLEGQPVIARTYFRAQRAKTLNVLLIATSVEAADDPIANFCASQSILCFRGHATDVLDRVYRAARQFNAQTIVRLTGDCPLIDPQIIDDCVLAFQKANPPLDFLANRLPERRTFPIGLDVEVCSFSALQVAWEKADQPYQREHVMPYLYDLPGRFMTQQIDAPGAFGSYRWTLDAPEDLELLREIYRRFEGQDSFSWLEVLDLLDREPQLALINADVPQLTFRDEDPRSMGSPDHNRKESA